MLRRQAGITAAADSLDRFFSNHQGNPSPIAQFAQGRLIATVHAMIF
jgi:hypothetical protein